VCCLHCSGEIKEGTHPEQDIVHGGPVAVYKVHVFQGHAAGVQQPQALLHYQGHLGTRTGRQVRMDKRKKKKRADKKTPPTKRPKKNKT